MVAMTAEDNQRRRHEADEVGAMAVRTLRSLARRAGEGDELALEALAEVAAMADVLLGAGVASYREAGKSWADVARVTHTTRQGAQRRFGRATSAPAHGPRCTCQLAGCPNR
jgi:hypothetical protein